MGERHLLWIVNIWRQTESVRLSVYDRKPSSQHMLTSWTSSGTNRKHNLHISPPVDTWSHTCTHSISKSTSTACHITIKWTTHTKLLPRTRCEIPPPCHTPYGPYNQHRLTDRTGMASGLVCKGCSTSYLFAASAPPLYRSALLVAPPLLPISLCLIT